jgi:GT2 family glycosyltransferase
MSKRIGVVTVTYNSARVIDGFMNSVLTQAHADFELYIVDNASKDATLSLLASFSDPRIHLILNKDNLGVAEGNNQGIREATESGCKLVLLINNDTEFGTNLFSVMLDGIDSLNAAMLVPKIMYFEPKNKIWCAGGYFKPWMGYSTGHSGEGQTDRGQFDTPRAVQYAPTCCMLIRLDVFDTVGLMDPRYFVYYDDTDFCWRAKRLGVRLWYDPAGILYHKVSSLTGGIESDFTVNYAYRNQVYFALKNLGLLRAVYCMVLYPAISLIRFVIGRDSRRVYGLKMKAYFKGIALIRARMT